MGAGEYVSMSAQVIEIRLPLSGASLQKIYKESTKSLL